MYLQKLISKQLALPKGLLGRIWTARWLNNANRYMNVVTIRHLSINDGDRVLEVGFGGGDLIKQILAEFKAVKVTGVDLSIDMVKALTYKQKENIQAGRLELIQGDVEKLMFDDRKFNKICSVNNVYFWANPLRALEECYRVLEPGGTFVLCFDSKEDLENWPGHKFGFRLYDPQELAVLIKNSGFDKADSYEENNGQLGRFYCLIAVKKI